VIQRSEAPRNLRVRAVLTSIAFVSLIPVVIVLIGAFLPQLPVVGRFGLFVMEDLHWVVLLALAASVLAAIAAVLGGGGRTRALLVISGVFLTGAGLVVGELEIVASTHDAHYSAIRQVLPVDPPRDPNEHVRFATVDGQELSAEIWWPFNLKEPQRSPEEFSASPGSAVVFVHGGGFWGGNLRSRPALFMALADRGYAVFDVDYRLSPPPRWDQAPGDVLCALGWVGSQADAYGVGPTRIVIVGESAGGNLALMAAYAAGTDRIAASCPFSPVKPAAVIAISPTVDLTGIWDDGTLSNEGIRFPEHYIGGPPSTYPDRYAAASPLGLISADVPPTLMLVAANDHLVHPIRSTVLVDALRQVGASVELVVVPFADHGFDGPANAFGEQLEESLFPTFIAANT
jgi:acetyl esterase/lipase